jgi:hypothetical protein
MNQKKIKRKEREVGAKSAKKRDWINWINRNDEKSTKAKV